MVLHVVFVIVLAACHEPEFAPGLASRQKTDFTSGVTRGDQEEITAAARPFDIDAEALVRFFKEQHIGSGTAESVAIWEKRQPRASSGGTNAPTEKKLPGHDTVAVGKQIGEHLKHSPFAQIWR